MEEYPEDVPSSLLITFWGNKKAYNNVSYYML